STISARLVVPGGAPDHLSGGETFLSSQVYLTGIGSPSPNAVLVSCMWPDLVVSAARESVTPSANRKQKRREARRALEVKKAFMDKLTLGRAQGQIATFSMKRIEDQNEPIIMSLS